jgi:hypothetical protein
MNRSNSYDLDDVSLSKALESPDIRDAEEEARKRHFSDNYSPMFVSLRPSEEYNVRYFCHALLFFLLFFANKGHRFHFEGYSLSYRQD